MSAYVPPRRSTWQSLRETSRSAASRAFHGVAAGAGYEFGRKAMNSLYNAVPGWIGAGLTAAAALGRRLINPRHGAGGDRPDNFAAVLG